jgi:hypothetical protein
MPKMAKTPQDENELQAQLKHHDVADIVGVVSPLGAWTSQIQGGAQKLMFTLEPWRNIGGAIQDRKLTIRGGVSEAALAGSALTLIKALDVVRVQARVEEESVFGTLQGELVEIVAVMYDGDADLTSRAAELGRPVRVKDDRFGLFTLDQFNCFENDATWKSDQVVLCLKMSGCDNVERLMTLARALWDAQDKWDRAVRECAVISLLELKNENWLADDEEEVTAEQFFERITPEQIVVYHTGRFEFWCNDDDMFGGHAIEVIGNLFDGAQSADIQG